MSHGDSSGNVRGSTGATDASPSPRAGLLASLAAGLQAALAAGDVVAVQVMHKAIDKLLDIAQPVECADVVDLAEERRRRERDDGRRTR